MCAVLSCNLSIYACFFVVFLCVILFFSSFFSRGHGINGWGSKILDYCRETACGLARKARLSSNLPDISRAHWLRSAFATKSRDATRDSIRPKHVAKSVLVACQGKVYCTLRNTRPSHAVLLSAPAPPFPPPPRLSLSLAMDS